MRPILQLILISVAFACQNKQTGLGELTVEESQYTEAETRQFFEDSIAGPDHKEFTSEKFTRFLKRYYPQLRTKSPNALIYAMEETLVDATQIDTVQHWFRVTVDPCFRKPYCMIVEKNNGKSSLTIKVTNGFGCQYPGVLASTTKFKFVGELFDTVATRLESLNFWALGNDTTCLGGLDGETWLIEALDKGKYNAIYRWMPQHCGDSKTRKLAGIVHHLATESRLDAILSAIGAPKSGL